MIVVRNTNLAAEKTMAANRDARYRRDVHTIRKTNVVTNRYLPDGSAVSDTADTEINISPNIFALLKWCFPMRIAQRGSGPPLEAAFVMRCR